MSDTDRGVPTLLVFRRRWTKIVLVPFLVGIVTLALLFLLPNHYRSSAVITPAGNEAKQLPSLSLLSSFEIIAGAPTKLEDLL